MHPFLDPIKKVCAEYFFPLFMTLTSPFLMAFGGVITLNATQDILKLGSAFFGLLTAMLGFVVAILSAIYWKRKLQKQSRPKSDPPTDT